MNGNRLHQAHAALFLEPKDRCQRLRHEVGIRQAREFDQPHAIRKRVEQVGGDLQREPRLAAAAGAGQREQPGLAQQRLHFRDFLFAADEARQLLRQVVGRRVQRAQRRERALQFAGHELPEVLGARQIAQADAPQVQELDARRESATAQVDDRLRHQDLAAVRGAGDARRTIDGAAEVVAVADLRDAGVQSAAHPERNPARLADRGHAALQAERRRDRRRGVGEDRMQSVADHFHHAAAVRLDLAAAQRVVTGERIGHPRLFGLPKARAALDIGEQERHRGCRGCHGRR